MRSLTMIALVFFLSGCSVYMAATQPDERNLSVLAVGMPRALVISELGDPKTSEERGAGREDVYKFTQGYKKGTKAARAVWHTTADVLSLGLWEIVGTPVEAYNDGTRMIVKVTYDDKDHVATHEVIAGLEEYGHQISRRVGEEGDPQDQR